LITFTDIQQEAKGLKDLSDGGLLQLLHLDTDSQMEDNVLFSDPEIFNASFVSVSLFSNYLFNFCHKNYE